MMGLSVALDAIVKRFFGAVPFAIGELRVHQTSGDCLCKDFSTAVCAGRGIFWEFSILGCSGTFALNVNIFMGMLGRKGQEASMAEETVKFVNSWRFH